MRHCIHQSLTFMHRRDNLAINAHVENAYWKKQDMTHNINTTLHAKHTI